MKRIYLTIIIIIITSIVCKAQQFIVPKDILPVEITLSKPIAIDFVNDTIVTFNQINSLLKNKLKNDSLKVGYKFSEIEGQPIIKELKYPTKRFGIYGYGNINDAQNALNASGKFNCYFIPLVSNNTRHTIITNLSYNINASNSDTLLESKLIFPELGNSSFIGTIDYLINIDDLKINNSNKNYLSLFGEIAYKNIKLTKENEDLEFDVLNYTVGFRYIYKYKFNNPLTEKDEIAALSLSPYLNFTNIPNEDNMVYANAIGNTDAPSMLAGLGTKVMAGFNNFGVFTDFRYMFIHQNFNNRSMQGFIANLGFVVSAEIFSF